MQEDNKLSFNILVIRKIRIENGYWQGYRCKSNYMEALATKLDLF